MVPAGTPAAVVQRLNAEVNKALQSADMRDKLAAVQGPSRWAPPPRNTAYIAQELARLGHGGQGHGRHAGVKAWCMASGCVTSAHNGLLHKSPVVVASHHSRWLGAPMGQRSLAW